MLVLSVRKTLLLRGEWEIPLFIHHCSDLFAASTQAIKICVFTGDSRHPCKEIPIDKLGSCQTWLVLSLALLIYLPHLTFLSKDIPIILPENDDLQFTEYHIGRGLQAGEVELSNGNSRASSTLPEFNAAAMAQLQAMGFPEVRCQKALMATGNSDPEAAMEWLFMHMEDPDIDEPIKAVSAGTGAAGAGKGAPEPEPGQVDMIVDMGFTPLQARKALRETVSATSRQVLFK